MKILIYHYYASISKETNAAVSVGPIFFFKFTTALWGPNEAIVIPSIQPKLIGKWN